MAYICYLLVFGACFAGLILEIGLGEESSLWHKYTVSENFVRNKMP